MEQCGVLPLFRGVAMHDCWASYWRYPDIQHAVCCAHLLRELTGIAENHPEQKWASAFIDLLLEMKKIKDKAIEAGRRKERFLHWWNGLTITRHQSACLSITSWFRLIISFRSEDGVRDYLKIMSYIGTAHKQGHNANEAIRNAISGCPEFVFE